MGKSDSDKKVSRKNEDGFCMNCFSADDLKEPEPVPLNKIRKEHREKLKLYSFLASEISKPRVVPLKQKVSEPYAIGKKIDEKITRDPKFTKYSPKEENGDNKIIDSVNKINKIQELDSSLISEPVSHVYEVKGTVNQGDHTVQSEFNDISSDQISLAESVNENTLSDIKNNSITTLNVAQGQLNETLHQVISQAALDGTSESNSERIQIGSENPENNSFKQTSRKLTTSKPSKSVDTLLRSSKTKRKIPEDAYLPKSLADELNETDNIQLSKSLNKELENPIAKKTKTEKVKKSSKLFKLFTKSKSNKENKNIPTSKTVLQSENTNNDLNVEPIIESYNEVSVDDKFEKLFKHEDPNDITKIKSVQADLVNTSHAVSVNKQFENLYSDDLDAIDKNIDETDTSSEEKEKKTLNFSENQQKDEPTSQEMQESRNKSEVNEIIIKPNDTISQPRTKISHVKHAIPETTSNTKYYIQENTNNCHNNISISNTFGNLNTTPSNMKIKENSQIDNESNNTIRKSGVNMKTNRLSACSSNKIVQEIIDSSTDPHLFIQENKGVKSLGGSIDKTDTLNSSFIRLSDILNECLQSESELHTLNVAPNLQHDAGKKLLKKDSIESDYYSSQEYDEDTYNANSPVSHRHEVKTVKKSTPIPLNVVDTTLYYNQESGSIPEEPENLSSDEEFTRSPSFYKSFVRDMRDAVNKLEVRNQVDNTVYSKLDTPISITPKSTEITIKHKDLDPDSDDDATKVQRIKRQVDINATSDIVYENIHSVTESAKHDLPDIPESSDQMTMHYKIQIETPSSSVKQGQEQTVVPCSIIVSPAKPKRTIIEPFVHEIEYNSLESRAESDKVDNASSHGSDSGYTGSSNYLEKAKTPTPPESLAASPKPNISKSITLISKDLRCSMPALNKTSESDKNLSAYSTNSLRVDKTLDNKSHDKKLRWSTLSMCKKPYDIDDEVFSETLSPGHATLPRRSNSPLPHERDLDRDRFPINRSGLQARSESMASVYSGAGEGTRVSVTVRGDVQFSLLYNYRLGALEVGVKRCRDLAAVDVKRNRSDPYVKVYLLPDKSKAGKRKTKVKKNTLNPVFEENLSFVQPLSSLSSRTLWLSVWHADMFGRNDFLGEVTLPLADVVFDDPAPQWHKLHERTEQFDEQHGSRGDLIVGLKFELQEGSGRAPSKGTLHVLVKEAKNLLATKPNGLADVFCKSYLLPERGRLAKQKTSVARRTLNPRWEHTFTYRGLTLQELSTRALELSLWDRDRLASNDFMGAIRLSLGTGTYMGASVNWMDSVGKEVSLWQTMMQRPNFWVEGSLPLRPQLSN